MMSVGVLQKGQQAMSRLVQSSGSIRVVPASGAGNIRTLYTAEALGVDGYEKQRERSKAQFAGMGEKFRTKMDEFSTSDTKNMIFTEDLKNMVHLVENNPQDLELVRRMMTKFNQQNRHLRFGNFVFGPVVMRMYYYLNDPKGALEAFNNPDLENFFDQLVSFQILLDLLYNNQMYSEMLEVYETIKNKQVQMTKYPRNVMVLVFAALYKMNTVQSYELALKLLTEMKEVGVEPLRRTITFAAMLALNQNAPNVTLEVLSNVANHNYVTVRNMKMLALADIGRVDDALPVLRYSLEFDSPAGAEGGPKATVLSDVVEKLASAVEKLGNKEVTADFQRIQKALQETGHISKESLASFIETEIQGRTNPSPDGFRAPFNNMRRQSMNRSFRIGQSLDMRPRRNPMYERERRSLQVE